MAKIFEFGLTELKSFMTSLQFICSVWFAIFLQHVWFPSELCEKILKTVSAPLLGFLSFKAWSEAKKAYGAFMMSLAELNRGMQGNLMYLQNIQQHIEHLSRMVETIKIIERRLMGTEYYSQPENHEFVRQLVDYFFNWDIFVNRPKGFFLCVNLHVYEHLCIL